MNNPTDDQVQDPEPTFRATLIGFGRNHTEDSKMMARSLFSRGFADGTGLITIQGDGAVPALSAGAAEPDPSHELCTLRLDARQFAALQDALTPRDERERRS